MKKRNKEETLIVKKDFRNLKLSMIISGKPGSGKTRLAGTAANVPELSPVLYLDYTGNPESFRKYPNLPDVFTIDSIDSLGPIAEWLYFGQKPDHKVVKQYGLTPGYKLVVIDTFTGIQRNFAVSLAPVQRDSTATMGDYLDFTFGGVPRLPSERTYGFILQDTLRCAEMFLDAIPIHCIMTTLEREIKTPTGNIIGYDVGLFGQAAEIVRGMAKLHVRMMNGSNFNNNQMKELKKLNPKFNPEIHNVAFARNPSDFRLISFEAKDQYGGVPPVIPNPTMNTIWKSIMAYDG